MSNEINTKTVYLVEDDGFLGGILFDRLTLAGFNTKLIPSGDEALEAIKDKIPDIILLDIFLPGMDGLDVLNTLRKNEETKDIKVIVVSNTDDADSRKRAQELHADFVLKAAMNPDEIVEMAKKKLGLE